MSVHDYFAQLHRYLVWQTNKMRALERRLRTLEARLQEIEAQPRTSIERIEYKFDQLKVETLEGTLNIGIAPPGAGGTIEDLAVEPVKTVVPKPEPVLMRAIQERVAAYLAKEAPETLKQLEQRYGRRLDDPYRQFILQDIGRQTEERIRFYLQEKAASGYIPPADRDEATENEIFQKVKADIEQSLDMFLKHLPSGGEQT
ncbi:spore germination protein GerPC [Geobacillus sp. C56-T2]|uniref:spore germination protein GerPC n=1 Tax=Geobacillus sp. C56-T2 TaxID=600773 RepID=UPI0011A3F7E6|nr:spore germination protein GerPC [Geobacillus sp. C56-T2]NNV06161.1 spore gernimation protein GerPC [Geobacillus sp. MMMUD3]TWG29621.1 spore germination protein PC [Geobacillus sp. C56-T2]